MSNSLRNLAEELSEASEDPLLASTFRRFLLFKRHSLDLLVRCANNIDEQVMSHACATLLHLLSNSREAQSAVLRHGGLDALCECLTDYNVSIRLLALRCIAAITSPLAQGDPEEGPRREQLRRSGLLKRLVRIVSDFPAVDVPLEMAITVLGIINHVVTGDSTNQQLVVDLGGVGAIHGVARYVQTEHLCNIQCSEIFTLRYEKLHTET